MTKEILKLFSRKGLGGNPVIKHLSRIFIYIFNPFFVEGSKLYLPLDDIQFIAGYEREKVKAFKEAVKENNTVVDVGAHIGFYTMLAARLVGKDGKVYGFEPAKANFSLLLKNKEKNKYNNVILERMAVNDKTGKNKLYFLGGGSSMHYRLYGNKNNFSEEIEGMSLDDYFKNYEGKIDFIKINIGGSEGVAIGGMKKILEKNSDVKLIIQYSPKRILELGGDPIYGLNILKELGFRIWLIKENLEFVNDIKELVYDDTTKELFCKRELKNQKI